MGIGLVRREPAEGDEMKTKEFIISAIGMLACVYAIISMAIAYKFTTVPPICCGGAAFLITVMVCWFGLAMCKTAADTDRRIDESK